MGHHCTKYASVHYQYRMRLVFLSKHKVLLHWTQTGQLNNDPIFSPQHVTTAPSCQGLLTVKASLSHLDTPTLGRPPMDEWSARYSDLYLTIHNTQQQTSMPSAGLKPIIQASERPQIYALDRAATGIFSLIPYIHKLITVLINLCVRMYIYAYYN